MESGHSVHLKNRIHKSLCFSSVCHPPSKSICIAIAHKPKQREANGERAAAVAICAVARYASGRRWNDEHSWHAHQGHFFCPTRQWPVHRAAWQHDPSAVGCFCTTPVAEEAIVDAVRSSKYNCYSSGSGILPARCAIADYLSRDLPYELSPDDIYLTAGCVQAIEVMISVLARPGSNILLPRPGFPLYESRTTFSNLEVRHFDLIPERGWEADLESVEALADGNTVAIVIINPSNPCGSVYSYDHLAKIAETARELGILIIADEVYDHLAFGNKPFIPMGVFGETVPVITLGSISKRWVVPGWRLGWIATCDPNGILEEAKINQSIANYINISTDPATFIQGAIPQIIAHTKDDFFNKILDLLRSSAEFCYGKIKEIRGITCPHKPEGSMFVMVKLDFSCFDDICDDMDFCCRLAKEESVIVLPGSALGMKDWLRITFAIDLPSLEDGLERIKSFCQRHGKLED